MDSAAADRKKWVLQHRLAEAREKAELQNNAPSPARALERGLALIDFAAELRAGERDMRGVLSTEDLRAYRSWATIRTALRVA